MSGFAVVDANVAAKWILSEVLSPQASALKRSWAREEVQPVAPYLMPAEVANILRRRVVRGELSSENATALMDTLMASGIELLEPSGLHGRAIRLAHELRQDAAYDAHYLALAIALECDLWTADHRFYLAASPSHSRVRWLGTFSS
ncbi:MAG: type II toxin-antitoxin system VapC family toxin [Chloroflexi bacterium]|nr:type II toxin-antitoxin system VapC family toxin [Chloroflexota bacterium]